MEYSAISDKGIKRERNEDFWNIVLDADGNPRAFIIADGMGGHQAGEVASRMAVESISQHIGCMMQKNSRDSMEKILQDAVFQANHEIYQYAEKHLNGTGTGTTLTAGILNQDKLTVGHIGDSSLYLVRGGRIEKLTRDHSFVGELVEKGVINQEEAKRHPLRNQITRALGYEKQIEVDFYSLKIQSDDIYLFCTDGLTTKISSDEILSLLTQKKILKEILGEMLKLAIQRGGDDNITAIAVKM